MMDTNDDILFSYMLSFINNYFQYLSICVSSILFSLGISLYSLQLIFIGLGLIYSGHNSLSIKCTKIFYPNLSFSLVIFM